VLFAGGLFGAHVGGRADGNTRPGQRGAGRSRQRLGDPEVGHHDSATGSLEKNVVRFDVPVHYLHRVGGAERVCGFLHDAPHFFDRELPATLEPVRQRFTFHQAHHEIDQTFALTDRVDGYDVRVRQPGRGLRLTGEAFANFLLERQLGRQDLDGHSAFQPVVACTVNHTHAATANLALYSEGAVQRLGKAAGKTVVVRIGHSPSVNEGGPRGDQHR